MIKQLEKDFQKKKEEEKKQQQCQEEEQNVKGAVISLEGVCSIKLSLSV